MVLALGAGGLAAAAPIAHADKVAAPAQDARLVPTSSHGKLVGFKVFAIREGSRYARAPLANGDLIEKIDGVAVTIEADAAKVTDAHASVKVVVRRKGAAVKVTIPAP